ncbi:response regulator [Cohnella faecalis]|uniref:Response regulator n=1 Tax=Cohnella faecalis TaxID=2315694 RepID=A0A398CPG6_9BACL|nr:response regulator [Cohnella faecalis]RIE01807.1 response regulator [Cohnella faecalis]
MLNAILIDDEEIALDVLEILLLEIGGIAVAGKFRLAADAIECAAGLKPDLIFLDIEMPGTNGLAAAELLLSRYPDAEIVFVTAHHQYAVEAFDTNAIGYLLKPVAKEKLVKTLGRYTALQAKAAKRRGDSSGAATGGADRESSGGGAGANAGVGSTVRKPLNLKAMGSLELYDAEGRLVTWRTKKTKELFAYLWHHGGSPVYRYRILDHLWPELAADRAQTLFHTTLYNLRSTLRTAGFPEAVAFGDERYWMRTDDIGCDADRLDAILRAGDTAEFAEELLSLYRGDYLETEYYGWAESRRYELRSAFIRYLDKAVGKAGMTATEPMLRKLIEYEPYRERSYDLLLQHLTATGDTAGADRLRQSKNRIFDQELGLPE